MSDFFPGITTGAFVTALACVFFMADKTDSADKFAVDYQANEFSRRLGFSRHVCFIRSKTGMNPCWGLLNKGMVVEFQCDLGRELNKCELVRQ